MKIKFVVKLEERNSSNRFLVRNTESYNRIIPFAFRYFQFKEQIAYFDSKEEAIAAYKEAFECEGAQGLPVILEAIVEE